MLTFRSAAVLRVGRWIRIPIGGLGFGMWFMGLQISQSSGVRSGCKVRRLERQRGVIWIHFYVYTTNIYMCIYQKCKNTYVYLYMYIYVRTSIHTNTYVCLQTYIHVHVYIDGMTSDTSQSPVHVEMRLTKPPSRMMADVTSKHLHPSHPGIGAHLLQPPAFRLQAVACREQGVGFRV